MYVERRQHVSESFIPGLVQSGSLESCLPCKAGSDVAMALWAPGSHCLLKPTLASR